ncbi:hypothetical protein J4H86_08795 [Spiractinospora alimapuensis]|uniref:NAD(P)H-dependent oxidoreductase n=1 Tax=Spiractinospora alimapuensis TaxID=2820884 RepID=UPI001F41E17C|nr:NAD(P)H-dependent oxidoreductase [Spiractinospora alimapuensis]QVQ53792.1 hypothetical protein J4H86_08795 [Spiractinospora alimapuensis]
MTDFDRLRIAVMRANDEIRACHTAGDLARRARENSALTIDEIDLTSLAAVGNHHSERDPMPGAIAALLPRMSTADGFIVVTSPRWEVSAPNTAWSWFADAWTHRPVGLVLDNQGTAEHLSLQRLWPGVPNGHTLPPLIIRRGPPSEDPRNPSAQSEKDTDDFLDRLCWWARVLRDARRRYPRHP